MARYRATPGAPVVWLGPNHPEALAALHAEFRPVAERTRLQIAGLDAERAESIAYADETKLEAQRVAVDGHREAAQSLANAAADLRAPFLGDARGGFGAGIAPLAESRTHLMIYDSATAFAAHFSPAVLANGTLRRETINGFRGALGRVDGCLGTVRQLRDKIKGILREVRDGDPVTPRRS